MKIAVYGAGKCGEYVIEQIKAYKGAKVEIGLFIDNNPLYCDQMKQGIPIVNLERFIYTYRENVECVLIAALDEFIAQEMVVSLLNEKYTNIYLLPEMFNSENTGGDISILDSSGKMCPYIEHISHLKPSLAYVEYHVSDYCNLKCKRCGHFSNLVKIKNFPDIDDFRIELQGLSKRFKNIKKFRLMGGEPFVNPDIGMFICEVKKTFPYTDLRIVSNGLLLPKITAETAKIIRNFGVTIDISQYPPTEKKMVDIIGYARENGLKLNIGKKINYFYKSLNKGISVDYEKIYKNCSNKGCHFLRKGRLYVCGAVSLIFENKDFLELNIMEDEVKENSYDLIQGNEDGWDILQGISHPYLFCKHCTDIELHKWSVSNNIKKEDWLVE